MFFAEASEHDLGDFFNLPLGLKYLWDCIKGLRLRHYGKLNSTHHGKLRCRSVSCTVAPQQTSHSRRGIKRVSRVLRLVYCGSCTAAIAAIVIFETLCFTYQSYLLIVIRWNQKLSRSLRTSPLTSLTNQQTTQVFSRH